VGRTPRAPEHPEGGQSGPALAAVPAEDGGPGRGGGGGAGDDREDGAGHSPPTATPMAAIFSGYCCEVAARWPAFTFFTPTQPPSTETISTPLSLPADLSAWYAPAAAGSLMV